MGLIERLKTERAAESAAMEESRAKLGDAHKRRESVRLDGWITPQLIELDAEIARLNRRTENHSKRVQTLDAEIGAAERDARLLRVRMGEKLLPFLVEMVTLTPEAAAAVKPLLNEYNQLVGED